MSQPNFLDARLRGHDSGGEVVILQLDRRIQAATFVGTANFLDARLRGHDNSGVVWPFPMTPAQ
jgi:hypothetical protein